MILQALTWVVAAILCTFIWRGLWWLSGKICARLEGRTNSPDQPPTTPRTRDEHPWNGED